METEQLKLNGIYQINIAFMLKNMLLFTCSSYTHCGDSCRRKKRGRRRGGCTQGGFVYRQGIWCRRKDGLHRHRKKCEVDGRQKG